MIERILYLVFIPGILANVSHMFLVKANGFSKLIIPIHEQLFGKNKTFRGFIVLIVFTAFFTGLCSLLVEDYSIIRGLGIGALLGFTYAFFELPNSFLKRRLGIKAGGKANRNKLLITILDKMDSTFGVSFVYYLLSDLTVLEGVFLFLGSVGLHVFFSFLLVAVKVKKSF